jgi:hypothetical protein
MRTLFDELVAGGASAVRGLLGREENLEFDCKRKTVPNSGVPDKSDKEILGRTLSAFANSMGGVLLWGVDAREDPETKIDSIIGFEPIAGIARFKSEIARLVVEALMPRHPQIIVESILDSSGNEGSGFLAIYVERSELRPHCCEFGHKYYYRRAGSSSRRMEHFEIEDAFRRLTVPQLGVEYNLYSAGQIRRQTEGQATIGIELVLVNKSRVSARFPYVSIQLSSLIRADGMRNVLPGISVSRRGNWQHFEGGADIVINPGMSRTMGFVCFDAPFKIQGDVKIVFRNVLPTEFSVGLGCFDSPLQEERVDLVPEEAVVGIGEAVLV